MSFLTDRYHVTKYKQNTSNSAAINSGIVQGSVLGPTL